MVKMDLISNVCLLMVLYTAQVKCETVCDIRAWYLTLISDDIFHTDLTPEMLQLKQSIETTVLNMPDSSDSEKKNCQMIKMYNSMLREKYNYDYESKHVHKSPSSASDPGMKKENNRVKSKESDKETDKDTTQNESERNNENKVDSDNHKNQEKDSEEDLTKEVVNQQTDNGDDPPDNNISNQSHNDEGDFDEDETELDETDMFEDEETDDEDKTISSKQEEINEEADGENKSNDDLDLEDHVSSDLIEDKDATNEENEQLDDSFITRSVPIGVCWSFGCLQSDVFDVFGAFRHDVTTDTNESDTDFKEKTKNVNLNHMKNNMGTKAQQNTSESDQENKNIKQENRIQNRCILMKSTCTSICFYIYSGRYCMIGYLGIGESENLHKRFDDEAITPDFKTKPEAIKSGTDNESGKIQQSDRLKDHIIQTNEKQKDKIPLAKTPEDNSITVNTKQEKTIDIETDKINIVQDIEREHADLVQEISDVTSKLDRLEKLSNENNKFSGNSKPSIDEFEKIVHETTSQYAHKIQSLEMMIMKLENNLLVEKLNKQNHSSTITRLENLILKLENDFLKLNTQYESIKSENENISKRQNYYLEIAYKNQKPKCNQLELPDKSAKTAELLSHHQSKINELNDILKNQSAIIRVIKDRYNTLEDQNRMLHQMIMNQTIFMTSIIHTMQDLTSQNNKNKEEIEALKAQLANKVDQNAVETIQETLKDNLLINLDRYAVDDKINVGNGNFDDADDDFEVVKQEDSDINLKRYLEHKSTEEIITNWCPAINDSCPVCFYRTVLSINCFPFRTLFWGSCGENCKAKPMLEEVNSNLNMEAKDLVGNDNQKLTKQIKSGNVKKETVNKVKTLEPNSDNEENINAKHTQEKDDEENTSGKAKHKDSMKNNREGPPNKDEHAEFSKENQLSKEKTKPYDKNNKDLDNKSAEKSKEIKVETNQGLKEKDRKENIENPNSNQTHDDKAKKDTKNERKSEPTDDPSSTINDPKNTDEKPIASTQKHGDVREKEKTSIKEVQQDKKPQKDSKSNEKAGQNTQQEVKPNKKGDDKKSNESKKGENKKAPKERKIPKNLDKDKPNAPKDCYDYYKRGNKKDGVFKINPVGYDGMIEVFCDMKNGGWTVIQRRQDGSMNFFKEWKVYKKGFGGLYGEHWLGNDYIHLLTNQGYYELRVDLIDWDKNKRFATYDYFLVEDEENGYRINIDGYTGDAGDGLSKHNGHKFSTKDVDNDKVEKEFGGSCAIRFMGAGWYYKCYASNLNGKYYKGGKIPDKKYDGVTWKPWTGPNYSLKKAEMKIKPAKNKK